MAIAGKETISAPFDWVSFSKTLSIEVAFLGSIAFAFFGHPNADTLSLCEAVAISAGATLGLLRLGDVFANIANVRSYLQSPNAANSPYLPMAQGSPLVKNGGLPGMPALPTGEK